MFNERTRLSNFIVIRGEEFEGLSASLRRALSPYWSSVEKREGHPQRRAVRIVLGRHPQTLCETCSKRQVDQRAKNDIVQHTRPVGTKKIL